jgi:hypothetical protein
VASPRPSQQVDLFVLGEPVDERRQLLKSRLVDDARTGVGVDNVVGDVEFMRLGDEKADFIRRDGQARRGDHREAPAKLQPCY